ELGRVVVEDRCVSSACKHFEFSYDTLDRLATLTYPDGEQVDYDYDAEGRLDRVTTPGPAPDYVTDLEWTPAGQLESMTYGNGAETTYSYDPEREWLEHATVVSGGQQLYDASYGMDPAGRIDSMTVDRGSGTPSTWSFEYDELNRLTLAGEVGSPSETYSYDSIGNLLTKGSATYEYAIAGMPHAVSKVGATRYDYNANGNRIAKGLCEPSASCASYTQTASYVYDAENRLTQFTDVPTGVSTSYAYAPGGQRVRAAVAGGETRLFFGDLVETRDGDDIYYYYAGPIRVAMKDTTGARTWYHHDHLGSVRLRTGEQGQQVESADYEPFGEASSASGEAGENPWDFAGHRTDGDSGLVYMNARYYDAEIGRFLTADPVVADPKDPQSLNRYAYASNNPISNVDPTG
ncbi:MAG: RHS repeat domain-containing protein, partial [Actinomycetota bacterium]